MRLTLAIKIGDPIPDDYRGPFILDIYDFIPKLTPPQGCELDGFDPMQYFITSGDAISKAAQLNKELYSYAGAARSILSNSRSRNMIDFERACWGAAGRSTAFINILKKSRGDAVFFETEWDQHILYCIPKNPRSRP